MWQPRVGISMAMLCMRVWLVISRGCRVLLAMHMCQPQFCGRGSATLAAGLISILSGHFSEHACRVGTARRHQHRLRGCYTPAVLPCFRLQLAQLGAWVGGWEATGAQPGCRCAWLHRLQATFQQPAAGREQSA